jgi:hypothetical protein
MNTAAARRLALGDCVVWIGSQPTGPGIIARISPHEVEVQWDCGTMTRYRRAQLHNLRHIRFCEKPSPETCIDRRADQSSGASSHL